MSHAKNAKEISRLDVIPLILLFFASLASLLEIYYRFGKNLIS
jgi:hypothetical protein